MTTFRVTQTMVANSSLRAMQAGLGRLAEAQERLTTGRVLNRPSDSPTDTTSAMRLRSSLTQAAQHGRNADDARGRLDVIDSTLSSMTTQVRRARELVMQGGNAASGPAARQALATEIDQLRDSLLAEANTSYLQRPVFGGITAGSKAYADGTDPAVPAGTWVGTAGAISRQVASDVTVRVDLAGPEVFGSGEDSLFATLEAASTAVLGGDQADMDAALAKLAAHLDGIGAAQAVVGARQGQVERAVVATEDAQLALTTRLSDVENVDLPRALVDLKLQEVAYQAALGATARVTQPSLLDFLR